jgi:predicted GNAT family acetyltransferase
VLSTVAVHDVQAETVPVIGLSDVTTLPGCQRRGFGSRVVACALHHAMTASPVPPRFAVLTATTAGAPVYSRLGFTTLDDLRFVLFFRNAAEWSHSSDASEDEPEKLVGK